MLAQLYGAAEALALAGLRSRSPHAREEELRFHLACLLLGEELARKVYGGADAKRTTGALLSDELAIGASIYTTPYTLSSRRSVSLHLAPAGSLRLR